MSAGAVAPLTILIIFPYVLGVSILPNNPGSTLLAVLSFIPLFSPTLMPMRIAAGIPVWETAVAIAVMLAVHRCDGLARRAHLRQRRHPHWREGQAFRGAPADLSDQSLIPARRLP